MIEESYVSFETSKLLKEAGFDCNCRKWYEQKEDKITEWEADASCNWNVNKNDFSCPTQALAERWLCERKMIGVSTAYCTHRKSWYYWVGFLDWKAEDVIFGFDYPSRQYAMEAGLQEAIKLIKK